MNNDMNQNNNMNGMMQGQVPQMNQVPNLAPGMNPNNNMNGMMQGQVPQMNQIPNLAPGMNPNMMNPNPGMMQGQMGAPIMNQPNVVPPMPSSLNQNMQSQTPNPGMNPNPMMGGSSISEEELVDAYLGPKAIKFRTGKFNVPAFFFTYLYLAYRKMLLASLICSVVSAGYIGFALRNIEITNENGINVGTVNLTPILIVGVILGIMFNKLYVGNAYKKVEKIKASNPGADFMTLKQICAKKGGGGIGSLILGWLIYGAIFSAILAVFVVPKIINGIQSAQENEVLSGNELTDFREIYKEADMQFMLESISTSNDSYVYSSVDGTPCGQALDIEELNQKYNYVIRLSKDGKVKSYSVTNGKASFT